MPRLVSGLEKVTGESHDSIARKARNWLNGKNTPKSRELLFQISFVLGLDEFGRTVCWPALQRRASIIGIPENWHTPVPFVWICLMKRRMSWPERRRLSAEIRRRKRRKRKRKTRRTRS